MWFFQAPYIELVSMFMKFPACVSAPYTYRKYKIRGFLIIEEPDLNITNMWVFWNHQLLMSHILSVLNTVIK